MLSNICPEKLVFAGCACSLKMFVPMTLWVVVVLIPINVTDDNVE